MIQDVSANSRRSSGSSRSRQLSTLQYLKLKNCDVTPGIAKAILRTIDGYGPTCWASLGTIAEDSGFGKKSVERAIGWLHAEGYLARHEPYPPQYLPDGRRKPTGHTVTYQVNWDHPDLRGMNGEATEETTPATLTPQSAERTIVTQTIPIVTQTTPIVTQTTRIVTQTTNTGYTPEKKTKKKPERGARAKPSIEEVKEYWNANSLNGDAEAYYDHYTANGWTQGKNKPIKDWQAAARGWSRRQSVFEPGKAEKADWTKELRKAPPSLFEKPK